ncbi:MAG: hypothetical protein ABII00_05095 [Elusimicrobiota bacterium]
MNDKHPEAKLLDLIRRPSPAKSRPGRLETLRSGAGRLSGAFFSAQAAVAGAIDRIEPLKAANALIAVALMVSAGYFLFVWNEDVVHHDAPAPSSDSPVVEASDPARHRYPYYVKAVRSRDLFGARRPVIIENKPAGPTAAQRAKGLNLMGFMGEGDGMQAVVLDRKAGVTQYLRKGDSIRGLQVEEVGGGRVVLTQDGDKVTLSL